jgi:hypothetical protein
MSKRGTLAFILVSLCVVAMAPAAHAQVWSLDLSGGRTVYQPVPVNVSTNNVVGTVRYDARRGEWLYATAALPLGDAATFWDGAGMGGRFSRPVSHRAHLSFGTDLDAHGFMFRDAAVQQIGNGAMFEGVPFVRLSRDAASVEVRGGWRGHTLAFAGTTETRGVFETGIRAAYDAAINVRGDLRWVHATEGVFPFVGASIVYAKSSPVGVWASAGKWLGNGLTNSSWGTGASLAITARSILWVSAQQDAPDPLYWNAPRRSWSVGITRHLTRVSTPLIPTPAAVDAGGVVIRVRAADAPAGDVFIAGSFNNWQPQPMRREGDEWVVRLQLAPGVYQYSFRSSTGEWFVPSSTPGRRDDGMGGHEGLLVVS